MAKQILGPRPKTPPECRVVIKVDGRGAWIYGNAAGLRTMANQLLWLADSPPEEHFECHLRWHLNDHFEADERVKLVIADELRPLFETPPEDLEEGASPVGFEVTFMQVPEHEIDEIE